VDILAYMFLDNHIHIIAKMEDKIEFSRFMQNVHSKLAMGYHRICDTNSAIIRDRPRTKVIGDDRHELITMAYIDANSFDTIKPIHPRDYEFTSYHYYAEGKKDPLITPGTAWLSLGETDEERQAVYRDIVDDKLKCVAEKRGISTKTLEAPGYYIGEPSWVREEHKKLKQRLEERRKRLPHTRDWPRPWNAGFGDDGDDKRRQNNNSVKKSR